MRAVPPPPPAVVPRSPAAPARPGAAAPAAPNKRMDLKARLAAPRRTLRGRVVLHNAGALVIEVLAASDALDWKPGATAQIELADGTIVTAQVDFATTTRAGSVAVGASARLGLALPKGTALVTPIRITIDLDGVTVVVDL